MKSIYFYLLLLVNLWGIDLEAQQIPAFKNYAFQPAFFNPARMGEGGIGVNYRNQWADVADAPASYLLLLDPSTLLNLDDKKIGIGFSLLGDKAHVFNRTHVGLSFAYYLSKSESNIFAIGINAGLLNQKIEFGQSLLNSSTDLAIFEGNQSGGIFNGGIGATYQYTSDSGHQFNIDISLPQLFTSDLNYIEGTLTDIQPFLLVRSSYKFVGSAISIEPILTYREALGGQKLKGGNVDIGARVFLLDNMFWVGGDFRLDAKATSINLGLSPDENRQFQIIGAYELNNIFGNSFETGLIYHFGSTKSKNNSLALVSIENAAEEHAAIIKQALKDGLGNVKKAETNLRKVGKGQSASREAQLRIAMRESEKADKQLQTIVANVDKIEKLIQETNQLITDKQELKNSTSYNKIFKIRETSKNAYEQLNYRTTAIKQEIENIPTNQSAPDIRNLFAIKDISGIRTYFQTRLNNIASKPPATGAVSVTSKNKETSIRYSYPNAQESYNMMTSTTMPGVLSITDHIAEEIRILQEKGLTISSVNIYADMIYAPHRWLSGAGAYAGEYGANINIPYFLYNKTSDQTTDTIERIATGEISLRQLGLLKIYSMQRYLQREKRLTDFPVQLTISGPNSQQRSAQVYTIEINLK